MACQKKLFLQKQIDVLHLVDSLSLKSYQPQQLIAYNMAAAERPRRVGFLARNDEEAGERQSLLQGAARAGDDGSAAQYGLEQNPALNAHRDLPVYATIHR
jgi:hypothetical protein